MYPIFQYSSTCSLLLQRSSLRTTLGASSMNGGLCCRGVRSGLPLSSSLAGCEQRGFQLVGALCPAHVRTAARTRATQRVRVHQRRLEFKSHSRRLATIRFARGPTSYPTTHIYDVPRYQFLVPKVDRGVRGLPTARRVTVRARCREGGQTRRGGRGRRA
eukprot:COSAG03_NODE_4105_length_1683_cov_3.151515_2_plen_160_part_00